MPVSLESPTSSGTMMSNGSNRKKSWNGSMSVGNGTSSRGYSPVKTASNGLNADKKLNVPFRDYDSASSDDELFHKPFSDHHHN